MLGSYYLVGWMQEGRKDIFVIFQKSNIVLKFLFHFIVFHILFVP